MSRSIKDVESALNPVDRVGVDEQPGVVAMDAQPYGNQPPGDVLRQGMYGKDSGLGKHIPSLQKMAEDMGPTIDTFRMILVCQAHLQDDEPHSQDNRTSHTLRTTTP